MPSGVYHGVCKQACKSPHSACKNWKRPSMEDQILTAVLWSADDTDGADLYQYWGLLPPAIVQPLQSCGTQNSDFGYGDTQSEA